MLSSVEFEGCKSQHNHRWSSDHGHGGGGGHRGGEEDAPGHHAGVHDHHPGRQGHHQGMQCMVIMQGIMAIIQICKNGCISYTV